MKQTTFLGEASAEARIRQDLDRIVSAVREAATDDSLLSILLIGGYARGEGAVVRGEDQGWRGFNDYDLLLVFEQTPSRPETYGLVAKTLATDLEIDFVDLGLVTLDEFRTPAPSLFWYEVGEIGFSLWSREDPPPAPVGVPLDRLHPDEGATLLLNRGLALLWSALRLWPAQGNPDAGDCSFATIASHKAVLAAGDAHLIRTGLYSVHQDAREQRLLDQTPEWAAPGFLDAYVAGCAFRRNPDIPHLDAVRSLWRNSRVHHEAGFRAAEGQRLGSAFASWTDHAQACEARIRQDRLGHPRGAMGALRRRLSGRDWRLPGDTFATRLPGLLYGPGPGEDTPSPEWRTRAWDLVREWHP